MQRADIPVFTQIDLAIKSTVRMIKNGLRPQELSHQIDKVMPVRMGHISVADKMINISKVYETLKNSSNEFTFSELKLAYRSLTRKDLSDDMIFEMAERHLKDNNLNNGKNIPSNSAIKIGNNLPPLDRITIDFDQFCAIMTELNEEQLKKNMHSQQTKSETIERRSMFIVWLYFLKSLPISFLKCLNRYFNIIFNFTISKNDKQQPDLMSEHASQFDVSDCERNEKATMTNGTNYRSVSRQPNGFEPIGVMPRKASQTNLPAHTKYVSSHPTSRYSIHFANNTNGNIGGVKPCDLIKSNRVRRHSVSQSRFSPSPPPPMTTSRHYQPYQGASRHHLHHHHQHHHHHAVHHYSLHTTDSSSSISSLMYNSKYTNLFIGGEVEMSLLEKTIIPELKYVPS